MTNDKTREPEFLHALTWVDAYYGTHTPPEDPMFDDPQERRAHIAHAKMMGWKPPTETT